jgi:hypothetical protein
MLSQKMYGIFICLNMNSLCCNVLLEFRPVREGVSTDSLKFHAGPPCPTLIHPAGGLRPSSSPLDTPSRTSLLELSQAVFSLDRKTNLVDAMEDEFHDQGDTKWIVIRRPLRGHDDTPFGRPTLGRSIGRPGVGHPRGVFGVLNCY